MSKEVSIKVEDKDVLMFFLILLMISVGIGLGRGCVFFAIAYAASVFAMTLILSAIPVIGPTALWCWYLPWVRSLLHLPPEFAVADVIAEAECIAINIVLIVAALKQS